MLSDAILLAYAKRIVRFTYEELGTVLVPGQPKTICYRTQKSHDHDVQRIYQKLREERDKNPQANVLAIKFYEGNKELPGHLYVGPPKEVARLRRAVRE